MRSLFTGVSLLAAGAVLLSGCARGASANAAAVPEDPASLVETYDYPDAARIFAEQRVKLISGDGHIRLADCSTPPVDNISVMEVWSSDESVGPHGTGLFCLKVSASKALLVLEIPQVYEVRGDGRTSTTGHEGTIEVRTDDGEHQVVELDPNNSVQVGTGKPGVNPPTTLLRIEITG